MSKDISKKPQNVNTSQQHVEAVNMTNQNNELDTQPTTVFACKPSDIYGTIGVTDDIRTITIKLAN